MIATLNNGGFVAHYAALAAEESEWTGQQVMREQAAGNGVVRAVVGAQHLHSEQSQRTSDPKKRTTYINQPSRQDKQKQQQQK